MALVLLGIVGVPAIAAGHEQVEQAFVDALLGLDLDLGTLPLADHADGKIGQVADHALNVAADVADLGVLGGLDLEEGSADQLGEPAGDLGFADAGGPNHDDVLRRDVLSELGRQLLAAPTIADGHRDRALGGVLADDVPIQLGDDLTGGEIHGSLQAFSGGS